MTVECQTVLSETLQFRPGYRILIFALAVLPICRILDAEMQRYSQLDYEFGHGGPL